MRRRTVSCALAHIDPLANRLCIASARVVGAGLVVLLLSTAAASVHAIQAARINPAQTLKQE